MTGLPYVRLGRYELHSADWYAVRAGRLGGSEIAAVMGLSPYESRFSLWHRKRGTVGPQDVNDEMDWGTRLEPAVLAKYGEDHPADGYFIGHYDQGGSYASVARPWQLANPDLLAMRATTDGPRAVKIIEAKTSPFGEGWGRGADEIPVYYRCQVMWYMDVFGVAEADVCVLISGCDYREYTVLYDEADARLMRDAAVEFLESVKAGKRPDIDGHDESYAVIKALHPSISDEKVDAPPDLGAEFVESRGALQAAETRFSTARNRLADFMGDAHQAWHEGKKIADRRARNGGTPYLQTASHRTKKVIA